MTRQTRKSRLRHRITDFTTKPTIMIFIFIGSIGKEGGMEGIIMNTLEGAVRKVASALTSGGPRRAPCA